MTTTTLARETGALSDERGVDSSEKLIVTWQHPDSRVISPIAILSLEGGRYFFSYLHRAREVEGFRPLLGFDDFSKRYESDDLFSLFAQRAMDPRRPDYERYVSDLGLDDLATPWEQIARSGGARQGDTLQLFPVPRFRDGQWRCYFLAHGMRYLLEKEVVIDDATHHRYQLAALDEVLHGLELDDQLQVTHESDNKYSDHSLLVLTSNSHPVGWVPDWFAGEIKKLHDEGKLTYYVERVNPVEAGWHMRLVVRLRADMADSYRFFSGERWDIEPPS